MSMQAPISHHLDLYRYWLAKRGSRFMPARSDIDPADIPALLPYLGLVNKVDDRFRYRLVGTAVAQEIGRDLTGAFVGSQLSDAPERVFNTAHPVFVTGECRTKWGTIHNVSQVILPLSDDGTIVNMNVCTRIARFDFGITAGTDSLKCARVKVIDVHDAAELRERCLDWERYCDDQRRRVEGIAQRPQ